MTVTRPDLVINLLKKEKKMYICTLKYTIKYPGRGKENPDWNFPCYSMLFRVIPCYSVALLPLPKTSPVSIINVLKRLFIESSVRAPACSLTSNPPEMLANRLVRANNTE